MGINPVSLVTLQNTGRGALTFLNFDDHPMCENYYKVGRADYACSVTPIICWAPRVEGQRRCDQQLAACSMRALRSSRSDGTRVPEFIYRSARCTTFNVY